MGLVPGWNPGRFRSLQDHCYSGGYNGQVCTTMSQLRYITPHGVTVTRNSSKVPYSRGLTHILRQLDSKLGVYLSSGYEYPERYSRWDVASIAPPVEIVGQE